MNNREARKLFKFKKFSEGYLIVEYRGSEREVIIPAQYRKKAVIAIEYCAFCHIKYRVNHNSGQCRIYAPCI